MKQGGEGRGCVMCVMCTCVWGGGGRGELCGVWCDLEMDEPSFAHTEPHGVVSVLFGKVSAAHPQLLGWRWVLKPRVLTAKLVE